MDTALLDPSSSATAPARWERDGWLLARGLLAPSTVAGLQAALARAADRVLAELHQHGLLARPAPAGPLASRLSAAGAHADRYGRSWRDLVAVPEVFALHSDPGLIATLRVLLGTGPIYGTSVFNARPKLPGQRLTEVPWHQDLAYFPNERRHLPFITAWTPAVPVDAANGCLQVWSGSHRRGLHPHGQDRDAAAFLRLPEPPPDAEIAVCAMRPGDVLFMHHLVWHASGPNRSDGIRWSLDCRFHGPAGLGIEDRLPDPWVVDGGDAGLPPTPLDRWRQGLLGV